MIERHFWYGLEVEGRFTGIETCFVRRIVPSDYQRYPHVYFTWEYVRMLISKESKKKEKNIGETWDYVREIICDRTLVTLEIQPGDIVYIPHDIRNRVHIIVRVSLPDMDHLKSTDTIAIDSKMYDVYTVTKNQMQHTPPEEYGKIDRP